MLRDPSLPASSFHAGVPPTLLVVAHRGSWKRAPENSLAAIEEAIAVGADMAEIDVQVTADGVLVVLHDETLERTTDGTGALALHTAASACSHRLRIPDGTLCAERIPSFDAVLACARGRILLNIDMKTPDLADAVTDAVLRAGMAEQVLMKATIQEPQDIDWACARSFHGRIPFMPRMHAHPGRFAQDLARFAVMQPRMAEVRFDDIADIVSGRAELQRQGARLWINTLDVSHNMDLCDVHALSDPDAVWGRLIDSGVGAIQTDESEALIAYLQKRGLR